MADSHGTAKKLSARLIVLLAAACSFVAGPAVTLALSPLFEFTIEGTDDQNPNLEEGCEGDCNGDGRVQVDELARLVGIALGRLNGDACPSLPAVVTVDKLVAAVHAALHGCSSGLPTPTPTPTATSTPLRPIAPTASPTLGIDVTASGIDLRPLAFAPARCLSFGCLTVPFESASLCVGNSGEQNAGPFVVRVNDELDVLFDGVPSGVGRCVQVPDPGMTSVVVDVDNRIDESDEDNNAFAYPTLEPTACDVVVPPCTPTPTVANVQSCDDCCDHCATEVCFRTCFGVQACQLITEWEGTVTDTSNGEPIANAEVTVNGRTVATDASGFYSTTSVRDEICNGLDYRYEISARAPGYRGFIGRMYQSLVPGIRVQNFSLEPRS